MKPEQDVRKLKQLLRQNGWKSIGFGKGSHEKFEKNGQMISVPSGHNGMLPRGTALALVKQAGLLYESDRCARSKE